jgi:hypothetical protein
VRMWVKKDADAAREAKADAEAEAEADAQSNAGAPCVVPVEGQDGKGYGGTAVQGMRKEQRYATKN